MKLSYLALGIGATTLLVAGIVVAMIASFQKDEGKKLPPAPLSLSEDRLNRLEADILRLKSENIKLREENDALRKESELLNKQLGGAISPPAPVAATDSGTAAPVDLPPPSTAPGTGAPLPSVGIDAAAMLGPDPTAGPVDGSGDKLTPSQEMVVRAPMLAKVVEFDRGWNILTFDAGQNQNVSEGMRFSIRRDRFVVCSVKVVELKPNHSVAEVVAGSLPIGMEIKVGDHVITYIPSAPGSAERLGAYGVPSEQGVGGTVLPAPPKELVPASPSEPLLPGGETDFTPVPQNR